MATAVGRQFRRHYIILYYIILYYIILYYIILYYIILYYIILYYIILYYIILWRYMYSVKIVGRLLHARLELVSLGLLHVFCG
jgi:hypothetical protein